MPSTARTTPRVVTKCTCRFSTSSSHSLAPVPGAAVPRAIVIWSILPRCDLPRRGCRAASEVVPQAIDHYTDCQDPWRRWSKSFTAENAEDAEESTGKASLGVHRGGE